MVIKSENKTIKVVQHKILYFCSKLGSFLRFPLSVKKGQLDVLRAPVPQEKRDRESTKEADGETGREGDGEVKRER